MMKADLSERLLDSFGVISNQLRLRYSAAGPEGVGFVAQATLRHLVRRGSCTVSDLAAVDRVTSQAISLRIRPLLEAGLVNRGSDPADGRRTLLSATAPGQEAVTRAASATRRAMAEAVTALTATERAALVAALPALDSLAADLRAASSRTTTAAEDLVRSTTR
jgi:DNA-binding MarR family transcriptional regulator